MHDFKSTVIEVGHVAPYRIYTDGFLGNAEVSDAIMKDLRNLCYNFCIRPDDYKKQEEEWQKNMPK